MSIKKKFLSLAKAANVHRNFYLKEKNSRLRTNFVKRIKWMSKGFLSESEYIYNLNTNDYKDYLSDRSRYKTMYLNSPYSFILKDKVVFEAMYKYHFKVPISYAFISKGKISSLDSKHSIKTISDIFSFLEENQACVFKPARGDGGKGIFILKRIEKKYYLNSSEVLPQQIEELVYSMDDYFMSEYLIQGEFANAFYPSTTNTLRIVTMVDEETQEAFIPIAVQRIGNSKSSPVDNWTAGGLNARINLETGELGKGVSFPFNEKLMWYDKHPESGEQIEGKVIPMWNEIKKGILRAASSYPYIKYVGWDVVLLDKGFAILEGNNVPDVNLLQVHTPLLKEPKVKKFYKQHNIL
ncbi:hypothetical protein C772_01472 [Bhargavaea cecembensis DSE10]|uniref:Alpha-L-glutamate ligase-related protein ATP-grasp domain-containing protein n=1 Tax=Bhargavaea cecembensis DSE10 TaxID=1235279 RepID=M7NH49_9BACL|nr:sugar-transfer associated ATP-grasp domain-containing protein [Bhargavaea cecembensis]EMR06577.1 hypothetical protein C772_01472 [Bhargavaea cecembensis DSE10]